jgi:anti-anti-sigma regulatory factor
VILGLRQLVFMDSTGLGIVVQAHQPALEAGRRFAVVRGVSRCSGRSPSPASANG